ncbi:kinetochore protein Spc24-like [Gigantopelta aegis]|uniref:kinetochore protein Spc24-like n=1 Tax=Gigantopelta aegis TaxID=1735272 RepID=UPI001B88D390|nr:kinetochore protein Spc24-like [Gigantopelta aegis]
MNDDYASAILVSNELLTILSAEDDELKLLEELAAIQDEIKKLRADRIAAIKRDIQGLLEQQDLADDDETGGGGGLLSLNAIESEIAVLEDQVKATRQHVSSTEEECQQLASVLNKAIAQQKKLRQKREQIKNDAGISLPKARYDVNLYSNISNIRWRYDCGPDEVSGYVCKKNDVKPFSIDTKQVSHFFLVNYLWDLMDEGE